MSKVHCTGTFHFMEGQMRQVLATNWPGSSAPDPPRTLHSLRLESLRVAREKLCAFYALSRTRVGNSALVSMETGVGRGCR